MIHPAEDRKVNGQICVLLREYLPPYLVFDGGFDWEKRGGCESWVFGIRVANMGGHIAKLQIGRDTSLGDPGLFICIPPKYRVDPHSQLPSYTHRLFDLNSFNVCIHDYVGLRARFDSYIPEIRWGKFGAKK